MEALGASRPHGWTERRHVDSTTLVAMFVYPGTCTTYATHLRVLVSLKTTHRDTQPRELLERYLIALSRKNAAWARCHRVVSAVKFVEDLGWLDYLVTRCNKRMCKTPQAFSEDNRVT